jgi:hypothetical protein
MCGRLMLNVASIEWETTPALGPSGTMNFTLSHVMPRRRTEIRWYVPTKSRIFGTLIVTTALERTGVRKRCCCFFVMRISSARERRLQSVGYVHGCSPRLLWSQRLVVQHDEAVGLVRSSQVRVEVSQHVGTDRSAVTLHRLHGRCLARRIVDSPSWSISPLRRHRYAPPQR